jgi:hypothetical protein
LIKRHEKTIPIEVSSDSVGKAKLGKKPIINSLQIIYSNKLFVQSFTTNILKRALWPSIRSIGTLGPGPEHANVVTLAFPAIPDASAQILYIKI